MTEPSAICTIGYEGTNPEGFVAALTEGGVATLVDVRAVPWSRKPGFSRKALEASMAAAGIGYVHLGSLGNPARRAARDGGAEAWHDAFRAHLAGETARAGLAEASVLARERPICLMCLEHDPAQCHRSFVAAALAEIMGCAVVHLAPVQTTKKRRPPAVRDLFDDRT